MDPLAPESLHGRPILLILARQDSPRACFLTGIALWTEGALVIRYGQSGASMELRGTREALAGFDPAVLSKIIVPEHYPTVAALAAHVYACVAMFSQEEPVGSMVLEWPFFGLGGNMTTGQVLLFQGMAEAHREDAEDIPPWASEPWEPDEEAT